MYVHEQEKKISFDKSRVEPAFACTAHKMQGATAKHGAVVEPSPNKPFARGLDYVTVSRPTEFTNPTLLSPLTVQRLPT